MLSTLPHLCLYDLLQNSPTLKSPWFSQLLWPWALPVDVIPSTPNLMQSAIITTIITFASPVLDMEPFKEEYSI